MIDIISYMYFIIFVAGMNMDIVISENTAEKFVSAWMSFVILRILSEGTKLKFREVEKSALKICLRNSHLSFDETCLNDKLLPTFTNIYVYVCVYIYIYIYIYIACTNYALYCRDDGESSVPNTASFHAPLQSS